MADKTQQGFAGKDEERRRENLREVGHASHDKGNAHEFDRDAAAEAARKGVQARQMVHASHENSGPAKEEHDSDGNELNNGGANNSVNEQASGGRTKRTRGGTHDQHVTAGKKGGSRIRELIELGYKYEEEHGIGPGRNDRSKLSARRRTKKASTEAPSEDDQSPPDAGTDTQ